MYRRTTVFEYILIVIGVLLVLNKLGIDLLKPNRKSNTEDDKKPKYPVTKGNLSYNNEAFKRLANRLVRAMDTDELTQGTYEEEVYDVFGYMHNIDDVHELYNVFGLRTYGGDEWGQWQLEGDPQYNLQTWLDKELNEEEQANVNKILKNKNIDFRI